MSPFAGPLFAGAGLLAAAGALKVVRPVPATRALQAAGLGRWSAGARALGLVEVAVAAAALSIGGRVTAALVASSYVGFALFVVRLRRRAGSQADCGCFGASATPVTGVHVVVNLGLALGGAASVAWPSPGVLRVMAQTPLAGLPFLGFTALLGWLALITLTLVPDLAVAASGGAVRR